MSIYLKIFFGNTYCKIQIVIEILSKYACYCTSVHSTNKDKTRTKALVHVFFLLCCINVEHANLEHVMSYMQIALFSRLSFPQVMS